MFMWFTFGIQTRTQSQWVPDSTKIKIDSLFARWNSSSSPGCAIGVIRNDSVIYAKGYGMANIEYAIPNTPETIFHMASVSKQFTALSIILLARQGKLTLDDDIHKYLPWFPDLKAKITIRHLLNHTSGIRDQWQLLAISGTRLDDVITQEHIVKVLSKQRALNFSPGEQYSYSNSGFTMLAEIVKAVSGQSLRKFADSAIFKPLGMNNTHFHDDYKEIVKGRSYSYNRIDSTHFANSILSYSNVGATSLFTNVNDMSKWMVNFYTYKVGDKSAIDSLTKNGKLNNATELPYANGIGVSTYKGWKMFGHDGGDAGYRTTISVFPDLKMGFILFGNVGDFNPGGKMIALANLFIKDSTKKKSDIQPALADTNRAIVRDTARYKKFMGDYVSDDGARFYFFIRDQKITWISSRGSQFLLIKGANDTFFVRTDSTVKFVFRSSGTSSVVDEYWPGNHRLLEWYDNNASVPVQELKQYTGKYFSPELNCSYNMEAKNHQLILTSTKYPDAPLRVAGRDRLFSPFWWLEYCQIIRNEKNQILGFEVNSGRVMHLRFNKIQ